MKHAAKHHCFGGHTSGQLYAERDCFTCPVISDCMSATVYKDTHMKQSRIDVIGQNGNEGLHYSDGSTASYYELPAGASQLQDLISYRDMNAQIGEIFRACYRYGQVAHSPKNRDLKKIIFYAKAELARLEKLEGASNGSSTGKTGNPTETKKPVTSNNSNSDSKVYQD